MLNLLATIVVKMLEVLFNQVAEKLHGLSVFEIAADGSEVVQLAWQPCPFLLEAVIPL